MPRIARFALATIAAAFAALVPAFAADDLRTTNLASDRFVAGGTVRQSEAVRGDLIGAAGELEVEAPVQGDVVTAGGRVQVRKSVGQGVYVAGGRVLIDAPVARNVRAAGGEVEIGSNATIDGNVSAAGGKVSVRGPVKGYLKIAGGDLLIDSAIGGDVDAAGGKLELGPNARIAGSLRYRTRDEAKRDPAAQVAGAVEHRATRDGWHRHASGNRWTRGWLWTIGIALLAVILAGALPGAALRVGGELRTHPWISLLAGFIVLVCVPAAAVILMITIVGIPIGLLALLLYPVLLIVGYVAAAVALGDLALARARPAEAARTPWRVGAAVLAVLLLAILARIPVVGGFVVLATIVLGMGALFLAVKPPRAAPAPRPAA